MAMTESGTQPFMENIPSLMKRTMSFEDRDKAMVMLAGQSPSRDILRQLRRNYSSQALLEKSRNDEADKAWDALRHEAQLTVDADPFMQEFLLEKVLQHASFSEAVIDNLADSFQCPGMSVEKWKELFRDCYGDSIEYHPGKGTCSQLGLRDLSAVRDRDPAATNLVRPFLYFKGYRAVQAHRISHVLWRQNRHDAAMLITSRMCELWSVDVHPAAVIGGGIFIDHATGVVVGETAVIGNDCSFLHNVTLGGNGKDMGDRHPKLGNDVLVGCGAAILGNITIGSNSKIGAGSIVLRDVPHSVTAVGNPARIVGHNSCEQAGMNMDVSLRNVVYLDEITRTGGSAGAGGDVLTSKGLEGDLHDAAISVCPHTVFRAVDTTKRGKLSLSECGTATGLRFGLAPPSPVIDILFADSDVDGDGYLNYQEYSDFTLQIITFTPRNPEREGMMNIWEDFARNSHSICMYLMARARLDLDSNECGSGIKESDVQELKDDQEQRRTDILNRTRNNSSNNSNNSLVSLASSGYGSASGNIEENKGGIVGEVGSCVTSESDMFGFVEAETTTTLK